MADLHKVDKPDHRFGDDIAANHWAVTCELVMVNSRPTPFGKQTRRFSYSARRQEGESDQDYLDRLRAGLAVDVAKALHADARNPIPREE